MSRSSDASPIRVLLVDDHAIVLAGLRAGLEQYDDIDVAEAALHGAAAVHLAGQHHPDVALVDLALPGMDGFETARRIREVSADTRVILLSGAADTSRIERALEIGADGFLIKTEPPQVIAEAIRRVTAGEHCFSEQIEQLLEPTGEGYQLSARQGARLALLEPPEREMLKSLAEGYSLKEIAAKMKLPYKAADHMKTRLMKKLQIHDRVELARFAISEGVVSVASPAVSH